MRETCGAQEVAAEGGLLGGKDWRGAQCSTCGSIRRVSAPDTHLHGMNCGLDRWRRHMGVLHDIQS